MIAYHYKNLFQSQKDNQEKSKVKLLFLCNIAGVGGKF